MEGKTENRIGRGVTVDFLMLDGPEQGKCIPRV